MLRLVTIYLFIGALALPAAAVSRKTKRRALALEKEGKSLYGKHQYKEAIVKFEKALELREKATLYFNLAQCYRLSGNIPKALKNYKKFKPFIMNIKKLPLARRRALLKEVNDYIDELSLKLQKEREARLAKERARIQREKEKLLELKRQAELAKAKNEKPAERPPFYKTWWFITGVSSTVLFTAGVTLFGLNAISDNDEWEKTGDTSLRDSAKSNQMLADLSLGAALIAAGTTAVLSYFYMQKGSGGSSKETPTGDDKKVRFGVQCLGSSFCGVNLGFRF